MENFGYVIAIVIFLSLIAFFVVLVRMTKAKLNRVANSPITTAPDGSINIPLAAAFSGRRGTPWVTTSQSDIRPTLVLRRDTVMYRVIRAKERPYSDIAAVDLRIAPGTVNIILEFHGERTTFMGNAVSKKNAAAALSILSERGCPLTAHASELIRAAGL